MARLHLVRHGETDWNAEERWQGHADRPLTHRGHEQAAACVPPLAALRPAAVYTSDLLRARDTAAPTERALGLTATVDPALREIDTGSWTGRTRTEILADEPGAVARHEGGQVAWEGGETFHRLHERVVEVLERIAAAHGPHDDVVVFTHGGVIRAAVAHAAGGDWRDARRGVAPAEHGARTTIRVPGWRLEAFNVPLTDAAGPHDVH